MSSEIIQSVAYPITNSHLFKPFYHFHIHFGRLHQGEKKDNCSLEIIIFLTTLFKLLGKCLRLCSSKK